MTNDSRLLTPDNHYYTIEKPSVAEFKDRGSRFIAYAYPMTNLAEFKEKLAALKKEHPKAVHHCFAYRLGLDGTGLPAGQAGYRVSDDGEPSGTAGRPILGQIDSKQLTNVLIVVVRYFGGTLLGVPGLINAYKSAAALCLQLTGIVQKSVLINYRIQFDHTQTHEVMKVVKQFNCVVLKQEAQLFCLLETGVPKDRLDEVLFRFRELRGVELEKL
ncbi:MAG: YigZ family protein [Bacteroidota bacterium]|nr:YigZ family protein [Bacteroidota bacterium]